MTESQHPILTYPYGYFDYSAQGDRIGISLHFVICDKTYNRLTDSYDYTGYVIDVTSLATYEADKIRLNAVYNEGVKERDRVRLEEGDMMNSTQLSEMIVHCPRYRLPDIFHIPSILIGHEVAALCKVMRTFVEHDDGRYYKTKIRV